MSVDKIQYIKQFPNLVASKLLFKLKLNQFKSVRSFKDQQVIRYLSNHYDVSQVQQPMKEPLYSKIIWTMWDSGIDNAPEIVQLCHQSMLKYKPDDYQIIVITAQNYQEYIDLPDYIVEKYEKGIISKVHLSDIIRVELLRKYGGIWIDSTVLFTKPVSLVESDFYSISGHGLDLLPFSHNQWALFTMGAFSNSLVIECLHQMMFRYWQEHDVLIDYYLIDYCLGVAMSQNEAVRKMIEQNKSNNIDVFALSDCLVEDDDMQRIRSLLETDTCMYKLTYKKTYNQNLLQQLKREIHL